MAVSNNFSASTLDLNGVVGLSQPTSLVWGPDGRLYVTEVDGDVKVLTISFGDPDPSDADQTAQFYVTDAVTITDVKNIPNYNDDGTTAPQTQRQVTGIDVTNQYDANGDLVLIDGTPAVTMYVTSSDSRIGAGGSGNDAGLDTNSGVITKLTQTGPDSWDAVDIVRGLARSEENHAVNGLEVIQTLDGDGKLIEERMIVSNGGNANTGAPSNNFAGQQEQPYSGALLEVDLDAINAITPTVDPVTGRTYVYDLPTLDDPTQPGADDNNDPFGGNDGLNSAKLTADSPVQIYSAGYRNAYDVEVTDDGRVFTYDNGANNNWGGRPVGEPNFLDSLYIALNLNNGDGNSNDEINIEAFGPSNNDSLHEATRSDDLDGRELAAGKGGPQTYDVVQEDGSTLTLVYGGHPNPTRAEGSRAGLLFSPEDGTDNAFLMVSDEDSFGNGGGSDYDEVIAWLTEVENNDTDYPDVFNTQGQRIYGADTGDLTKKVIAMTPGVAYDIYLMPDGSAEIRPEGTTTGLPAGGQLIGTSGLPSDIAEIVSAPNPIEGNYLEAGSEDGSLDFGKGSVNGLTEYTSTILDDGDTKMSGALLATSLNQGQIYVIGRDENGVVQTNDSGTFTQAADRTTLQAGGGPLGIATLGDDVGQTGLNFAFTGSIWVATFNQNGPLIEVFQPEGVGLPLAGADIVDEEDNDLDGVKDIDDPFEYSAENGYKLSAGETLEIDFNPQNTNFPISLSGTGLLGAALDGVTPNQDARSVEEGFSGDQLQDGLFDNGQNILPGGNAPILKIKTVVDGSVVGGDNDARDVMHTGFRPDPDVDRIGLTMSTANWIPARVNNPLEGQVSGMIFGDGTQANFLRVVYGGVDGGVGFEVGVEIGDANYTKLATVLVPGLSDGNNDIVDIQMIIDQGNNYAVEVGYRFGTDGPFTSIPLNGGAGYNLPTGVLQDVLNGDHTIQSAGGPELTSGAAVGFLAEDVPGGDLTDVDFFGLKIESLANELAAATAADVGQVGTDGADVIVYTGNEVNLPALDDSVENFDGSGSTADFEVTGNQLDNEIRVGSGANVITTGEGSDMVVGSLDDLDGDEITDFSEDDVVLVEGESLTANDFTFTEGSAVLSVDGKTITFTGPDFENFQTGDDTRFEFTQTDEGTEIRVVPEEQLIVAVNAGANDYTYEINGVSTTFQSDVNGPAAAFLTTGTEGSGGSKIYNGGGAAGQAAIQGNDFGEGAFDELHYDERSSTQQYYGYEIPNLENGTYRVDIYTAEIFHGLVGGSFTDNKRVMDITIEGDLVEDNFDIFDQPGGATGKQFIISYEVEVTDRAFTMDFDSRAAAGGIDQPKISAFALYKIGASTPFVDETAPEIVDIFVENPQSDQDSPRDAIITLTDNTGFEAADFAALDGSELVFSGIVPASVGAPTVEISANGTTATLTYELLPPAGSWPTGEAQISIAADAYGDAAGNTTAAVDSAFFVEPNLSNLVAGDVALAINVGETTNTIDASLAGDDKNTYGGAITGDTIINGIDLQADDAAYYTPTTKTGSNIDGKFGPTGSNTDLDGSALHTYRDAASGSFTATYPITNGIYVVELWFAELFHDAAGNRQGDYTINGEEFALNFDAFTEAGAADTAVKITKNVIVTNGEIVIDVNADTGQPGFNAIVVYDAIPSDLPPTVSVADVTTAEGEDATVTFSRIGDLSEDVTVEFTLTPDTAGAEDFGAPSSVSVTILAGESTASFTIPIVDDEDEEPAESFSVAITGVTNTSADAVVSATGGSATVTIAASDPTTDLPTGGTIVALDFETAGDPLVEGGFDTVLGGPTALEAGKISVVDGKLVVTTSQGDLSNVPTDASKNDLVRATDLSDPAVNNIVISTAFDNPFTSAYLASIGVTNDVVSNFRQQGIIIATGDAATNQNADQFMKVVYGGGNGTQTQLWSQGAVDQPVKLAAVGTAAGTAFSNADVARVELALIIDKAAGTIAQFVTYYDDIGGVLGGVRPTATPGFAEAPAQAIPAALLAAINNGTSVVGVTSTDFGGAVDAVDSFPATWDYLNVTSPQVVDPEGPDAVNGVVYVDFSDDGLNPTDVGAFENGSTTVVAEQVGDDEGPLGRDRDYFTFEVPEGQVLAAINLTGYENQLTSDTAGFIAIQEGTQVDTNPETGENFGNLLGGLIYGTGELNNDILDLLSQGGNVQGSVFPGFDLPLEAGSYTIWLNQGADLPTTVTLDFVLIDRPADVSLSIADAGDVVENGDFGVTVLAFEVTASDSFDGTLTVTYDTAIDTGLTQDVTFTGGVGTLTVLVDNDDVANGTEDVSVTLTSAIDTVGTDTVAISSAAATAEGSVTEDDDAGTVAKGAAVFALNVNGDEVVVDGVTYEADNIAADPANGVVGSNAAWTGFNLYTDGGGGATRPALADGDYDRDGTGFTPNDLLYVNERWGGAVTGAPMTYTRDGFAPGEYIMTLKLAELFNTNFTDNKRVFSVAANGQEVVTDLDLFDIPGLEADQAYDVDVPVTIGADGVLALSFTGLSDNAKINAFALYEAVTTAVPTDMTVSVADVTAEEDSGAAEVVFTREGDTTSDVTITFALVDGTGVLDTDYQAPATSTVTILAGETTATVPVTLINNADEATEVKDFTVSITDVVAAGGESASLGNGTATVTIEDDDAFDPADIDGDGVINYIDPLAYDGDNGLGNVLGLGGSFRQDFDVDTTNVFDPDAGFTGILVNTVGFVPPGTSDTDPYGDRTTEPVFDVDGNLTAGAEVKDGALRIVATETDTFGSGTPGNQSNQAKDNYVRGADVSGVELFSVEAKAANPWPTITSGQTGLQFASLGITLGAGGTDDWAKLVYGVRNGGVTVEFASQNSLTTANQLVPVTYPAEATEAAADLVFRLDVNKSSTTVGLEGLPTLTGYVTLLDSDGNELQTVSTDEKVITGSLLSSLNGENPLTGGTGGITYGISVTEWSGGTGNGFTGEWDYLELSSPDNAPVVDAGIPAQAAEEEVAFTFEVPADAFADDGGVENLTLTATLANGDPLPAWLNFDGTTFSGTPTNADANGLISIKVSADDGTNPPAEILFDLDVANVNDAPTATPIAVPSVLETDGVVSIELLTDAAAADEDGDILAVINASVTTAGGDPVDFDLTGQTLTIDPAQFAELLDGGDSVALTVTYTITDNLGGELVNTATLLVGGADGPFTWYLDADSDGFGTDLEATIEANTQPDGYVLQAGDLDDSDDTIYPDAPEINDGKDNDQDGETDEDNTAPIADDDQIVFQEGDALEVPVTALLAGDTDLEGDTLTMTEIADGIGGTVALDAGVITFTPDVAFDGTGTFTYTVEDGFGGSTTATVAITVENRIVVTDPATPPTGTDGIDVVEFDGAGDLDLSDPSIEEVDLSGNTNDGGTVTLNTGDNTVKAGEGQQTVNLGAGGADKVTGTADQLNGDTIGDFDAQDSITVEGGTGTTIVSRFNGSAIIGLDTDGDGIADTTVTLSGDAAARNVVLVDDGSDVTLTLDPNAEPAIDLLENGGALIVDLAAGEEAGATVGPVTVMDANGDAVAFTRNGDEITIDPAQYAADLDDGESLQVTMAYDVTDTIGTSGRSSAFVIGGVDGPIVWYIDADGDGFGDDANTLDAYDQPVGYVAVGGDNDDADLTVYPDAPEINDGKDNDQDGETDEDNQAPVAGDDAGTGGVNRDIIFTRTQLLSNDSDPDGDPITFDGVSNAVNGTVSYDTTTGIITFTPDSGYLGNEASFDYTVSDGFGGTTVQTVAVEVTDDVEFDVQDLLLSNAGVSSYAGAQDAVANNNIVDEENQIVTVSGNSWKKIELPEEVMITNGMELWVTASTTLLPELLAIGFDSDDDFQNTGTALFQLAGTDVFPGFRQEYNAYETPGQEQQFKLSLDDYIGQSFSHFVIVNDKDLGSQSTTTTISGVQIVRPTGLNTAPIAAEDAQTMENSEPLVIPVADLLANDSDADGDTLSITSVGNATNGVADLQDGQIVFTATEGYTGPATFQYTISDGAGGVSTTTVNVTVLAPGEGDVVTLINFNDNPIVSYDDQDSKPGAGFEIGAAGGSLTLNGNVWKKTVFPDGDYVITEDTVLRFDLTVLNPSGEIVAIALENDNTFKNSADTIFQLFGSQNFTGFSNQDFNGIYGDVGQPTSYEISLRDLAGQSFSTLAFLNDDDANGRSVVEFANVQFVEKLITVTPGTEAPEIFGGEIGDRVATEDTPFEMELPFFDTDTPFEDLTFSFQGLPDFVTEQDGILTGLPTNDDVGVYSVTVTVTDPDNNSTSGTFTLTVGNVNDAPELTGTYADVNLVVNNEINVPLPAGLFVDVDQGDVLTYSATGLPEGVIIDPNTGGLSGIPTVSGNFAVTIIASDGPLGDPGTLSASVSFGIDIASGPPRESVLIQAEDFDIIDDPDGIETGFFTSFARAASGRELIQVGLGGSGTVSKELSQAGVAPGFYDIAVIHFDENDGSASFTLKLDFGDGSELQEIGTYVMDRTDLPNQGGFTERGNITEAVFSGVNIPAGASLIIQGQAESGELVRIDSIRFDPINNSAPVISTPAEATVQEGTLVVADVDATDLEGSDVSYAIVGGADAALFAIDPLTGEVSFLAAPDFEAPLDADGDNVYDVVVAASDGDASAQQSLVITVTNLDEVPEFSSPTAVDAVENDTAAATVAAVDPDGAAITYALAGTGADEALFAVDPTTGVVTFLAAADFETPGDADVDGVYEVSVTADDGTSATTTDLQITVTDANDAPVAVADPAPQPVIIDAPLSLSIVDLFTDQDAADTLTYTLISGAPAGVTGIDVDGNLVGTPTEIGAFDVVIEASDGIAPPVQTTLTLNVDAADNTFGRVAPSQDLDEDGTINSADDDVDGDGILNVADSFAYDADNGTLIADGESIELTFDVNGTPYQNGFTGLLQAGVGGSSDLAAFDEDTGVTTVADGLLTTIASDGDTGTTNTPEDDFQLGVKNADFSVEARVVNPFETQAAVSFDQIGIHVGVDSTDFVKFVFGNAIEFSSRIDDAETKATGGNQVLPAGLTPSDFSAVDITLNVNSTSATAATVTAIATFLDTNGDPIAGATGVSFGSLNVMGAMAAALADEGVGVGAGFTHAHAPTSAPFTAQLDSFKVTATDGGSVDPSNALAVFEGETDIFTGNSYGTNEVGAAVLEVMTGNNNIQSSNFGQNSFELTNTGDKQIAAVFIDVSTALYPDSVFDPDGAGGDDAVKPWGINSGGAQTGASISGGTGGYFLAGIDPLANTTGTGQASNGGFKGAIIKFTDFQSGEQVGFSGDMDPNSLAGLDKGSTNGVDTNAINGWDAGGISGHEIIGSTFTILFDDGSTATGQLASDGSAAGAQGLATEAGFASDAPTLTVNGFGAGDLGTYGGEQPTILLTGDPGSTVRITMTKGFNPVDNATAGIDTLVEDRLERYDFKASNAFDAQSVDVVIGDDGTFDATGLFDYDDNLAYNGTFTGDDVAEIGFVASVVDPSQGNLPVSPVTKPIYLSNEGGPVEGDPVTNDGGNALEVFAGETDLITSATYGDGDVGSAVLGIMTGSNDIEDSNFGANSFQVTNTGDKKISAVFIDVTDALYQDSVFDPDGAGGDSVAKPWAVNSAGGTGAYINGGTGGFFLPGQDPLANTTGTGQASDGGYKGAIVKFTDFNNGETVGFSGDMDPNSIAGLTKGSVDTAATDSWDVGGISGHELIGSRFTVLFDDGTTASGQLASDGSASGSQALASQNGTPATTPTLTVNGVAAGGLGTYGGTQPTIIVTGDAGDTVRITLTKGFNPVENTASGIAQLVEDRLDRYDFKASNNFDSQSVDVVIGADGTFDATGLFDYDDAVANNKEDGTFAGDDVAQIGFVASVIDPANNDLAISAVTAPIYLTNDGGPVAGDPVLPTDGFFEIIGSGNNARFKIQVEDPNGSGGTNPGTDWTYATAPDDGGNHAGFQGDGYYVWKEGAVAGTNPAQGIIEYEIFIPEGDEGVYSFRARSSRDNDPAIAGDQANDIWLRIDDDAEALQVNDTNSVSNAGFVKVFGVGTGGWGNSVQIDSVSEEEANFAAQFELSAGFHTIAIAGRSGGYAIDFFDLYKGGAPNVNASNSTFTTDNPGEVGDQITSTVNASSDDWEEFGGAGSGDLEFGLNGAQLQSVGMRFTNIDIPDDKVIAEAYFQFEANGSDSSAASFTIEVEATEAAATYSTGSTPDDRSYLTEDFDWNDVEPWTDGNTYRTPDISDLIEAAIGTDGVLDGELGFRITGSGGRAAHSFDSDGAAPELVIMFEDDLII